MSCGQKAMDDEAEAIHYSASIKKLEKMGYNAILEHLKQLKDYHSHLETDVMTRNQFWALDGIEKELAALLE